MRTRSQELVETGSPELHLFEPATGEIRLVSTTPARSYHWIDDEELGRQLMFWDTGSNLWRVPIPEEPDGSFSIGTPVEQPPQEIPEIAFTTDLGGNVYSIEASVTDGPPSHLVVVEHWTDSVTDPDPGP